MCGSVMWVNICQWLAPSTAAASRTSPGRDCRPASRISVMNGVHCQIRVTSMELSGNWVIQSTCGALSLPKMPQIQVITPLSSPKIGL